MNSFKNNILVENTRSYFQKIAKTLPRLGHEQVKGKKREKVNALSHMLCYTHRPLFNLQKWTLNLTFELVIFAKLISAINLRRISLKHNICVVWL